MLLVIDPHRGVPAYRQIVDQVRLLIASGQLLPGDELPSTRSLARQLGINPMTVSKAYGLLEADGLVQHRPGLPLAICALPAESLEAARLEQLRAALEPGVLAARQLGVSPAKALAAFRSLLAAASPGSPPPEESEDQ